MPYGEKKPPELIEYLRSLAGKPVDENKRLTKKEQYFLELLVIHNKIEWEAYDRAYPARKPNRTKEHCLAKAKQLLKKANVAKRYKEMTEEMHKTLQEYGKWAREDGIKELLSMIEKNKKEQERINETYDDMLNLLMLKIQEADTADKKEKLLQEAAELRLKLRNNTVNNNAIIQSVVELNKMHGYNSQELVIKDGNEETRKLREKLAEIPTDKLLEQVKQMTKNE